MLRYGVEAQIALRRIFTERGALLSYVYLLKPAMTYCKDIVHLAAVVKGVEGSGFFFSSSHSGNLETWRTHNNIMHTQDRSVIVEGSESGINQTVNIHIASKEPTA